MGEFFAAIATFFKTVKLHVLFLAAVITVAILAIVPTDNIWSQRLSYYFDENGKIAFLVSIFFAVTISLFILQWVINLLRKSVSSILYKRKKYKRKEREFIQFIESFSPYEKNFLFEYLSAGDQVRFLNNGDSIVS